MSQSDELGRAVTNSNASALQHKYLSLSPIIEFGTPLLHERLNALDASIVDHAFITRPLPAIASGWVALELAAMQYPGSPSLLQKSSDRFHHASKIAAAHPDGDINSLRYVAAQGIIALSAYADPILSPTTDAMTRTIDDNPGQSAALIDTILSDTTKGGKNSLIGIVSELAVHSLIGMLGCLALPASLRHDTPITVTKPSAAYDIAMWIKPPTHLPAKPDRKLQVKSGSSYRQYGSDVSVISVVGDLGVHPLQLAGSLVNYYAGSRLRPTQSREISNALISLVDVLQRQPEPELRRGISR